MRLPPCASRAASARTLPSKPRLVGNRVLYHCQSVGIPGAVGLVPGAYGDAHGLPEWYCDGRRLPRKHATWRRIQGVKIWKLWEFIGNT